jgi:hypothetical protein
MPAPTSVSVTVVVPAPLLAAPNTLGVPASKGPSRLRYLRRVTPSGTNTSPVTTAAYWMEPVSNSVPIAVAATMTAATMRCHPIEPVVGLQVVKSLDIRYGHTQSPFYVTAYLGIRERLPVDSRRSLVVERPDRSRSGNDPIIELQFVQMKVRMGDVVAALQMFRLCPLSGHRLPLMAHFDPL